MAIDNEWLKSLKEGDKVYVKTSAIMRTYLTLKIVKKITPTGGIRTSDGKLFKNGYRKESGSWTTYNLVEWNQELESKLKAEHELRQRLDFIDCYDYRKLTVDQVNRIYDIMNE